MSDPSDVPRPPTRADADTIDPDNVMSHRAEGAGGDERAALIGRGPGRRSPLVRWSIRLGLFVVLPLIVLIALAPTIAAPILRPVVEHRLDALIAGDVHVTDLTLSWPAELAGAIEVRDSGGEAALRATVSGSVLLEQSLVSLTVEGDVLAPRDDAGRLTLPPALMPPAGAAASPPGDAEPTPPGSTPPAPGRSVALPGFERYALEILLDVHDGEVGGLAPSPATATAAAPIAAVEIDVVAVAATSTTATIAVRAAEAGDGEAGASAGVSFPAGTLAADGALDLGALPERVELLLDLPGELIDAVAATGAIDGRVTGLIAVERDGAGPFTLVPDDAPLEFFEDAPRRGRSVEAPVPPALVARLLGDDAPAELIATPTVRLDLNGFSLPAESVADLALTGLSLDATVSTSAVAGRERRPDGSPGRDFAIAPMTTAIATTGAGDELRIAGSTAVTFDDRSVERVSIDAAVVGLLDPSTPLAVRGSVSAPALPTALVGAFNENAGATAADLFGDTLAVNATATPSAGATDIDVDLAGPGGRLAGALNVDAGVVTVTGPGLAYTASEARTAPPAALAEALSGMGVEWTAARGLGVNVRRASIDLGAGFDPIAPLAGLSGELDLSLTGGSASMRSGAAGRPTPVEMRRIDADLTVSGGRLALVVDADLSVDGRPVRVVGDPALARAYDDAGVIDLSAAEPGGTLTVSGLPTALADRFVGLPEAVTAALGPTVEARLVPDADRERAWRLELASGDARAATLLETGPGGLSVGRTTLAAGLPAEAASELVAPLTGSTPLRVLGPVGLEADLLPVVFPLENRRLPRLPDDREGIDTTAPFGGLVLSGTVRTTSEIRLATPGGAEIGLRDVSVDATTNSGDPAENLAALNATLTHPAAGGAAGRLAVVAELPVRAGGSWAEARATGVHPEAADALLAVLGIDADDALGVSDALARFAGGPIDLSFDAVRPARGRASGRSVWPVGIRLRAVNGSIAGGLARVGDQWTVAEPLTGRWTLPADLTTDLILGTEGPYRSAAPTALALTVNTLTLGPPGAPLDPATFALDIYAEATALDLRPVASGPTSASDAPVTLGPFRAAVRSTAGDSANGPGVGFRVVSPRVSAGPPPAGEMANLDAQLVLEGRVSGIADASGTLTPGDARVSLAASGALPTQIIDTLAGADGLITDLVGPAVAVDLTLDGFGAGAPGGLAAGRLSAEYASATFDIDTASAAPDGAPNGAGINEGGALVSREPVVLELSRITPGASGRLFSSLIPFLEDFEKTAQDEPAVLTVTGLRLAREGGLRGLDADVHLDLGTVRYRPRGFIAELLDLPSRQQVRAAGERLEPMTFTVRSGVLSYADIGVPAGEFTLTSSGSVDLAARTLDITVDVPAGRLADEIARATGRDDPLPDRAAGATISVPITGSLDNPSADVGAAIGDSLLRTGLGIGLGILEDAIGNDRERNDDSGDGPKPDAEPRRVIRDLIRDLVRDR